MEGARLVDIDPIEVEVDTKEESDKAVILEDIRLLAIVLPENREPLERVEVEDEAIEGALNLFNVLRNAAPGDSRSTSSSSSMRLLALIGVFDFVNVVRRGGGNSTKSSSSSSS